MSANNRQETKLMLDKRTKIHLELMASHHRHFVQPVCVDTKLSIIFRLLTEIKKLLWGKINSPFASYDSKKKIEIDLPKKWHFSSFLLHFSKMTDRQDDEKNYLALPLQKHH